MTQPPQYPGTPEPPEEPQQPEGSPDPGSTTPPPIPPPASPSYDTPPPAPPYGAPQQPPAYGSPYGAPQPPQYGAPPQQPVYGAPQQPYGGYPTGPGNDQPSKAMAIAALVLSFLGCTFVAAIVAIVLAIVVLVRGKDGRNHGKGLAIAGLVISVVTMLVGVLVIVGIVAFSESQSIDNLEVGQCINADGLTDAESDTVGVIEKVSCSEEHDGEVVGTSELTDQQAADFDESGGIDCSPIVGDPMPDYAVYGLTQDTSPVAGDAVACVAVNPDGSKLTGKIG